MSETRVNRLLENVPTELRALAQWITWRYVNRSDGTATKVPYCAGRPDRHASSTDPATWATFAEALAVLERGGVDGVGFVFSEGDHF